MPEFSLVIPVYNARDFLAECLDSCINQTFRDIEIICVNDCSTDGSEKILRAYAEKDSRVIIINHEKNKRQGGSRNTGAANAGGTYCWFIDDDDSVLLNSCEILHEIAAKVNADIIRFNAVSYIYNSQSGKKTIDDSTECVCNWPYDTVFHKGDYKKLKATDVPPWLYISRTSLLRGVQFEENVLKEDIDFTPRLFSVAESIYCVNFALYHRRRHLNSITQGNLKRNAGHVEADIRSIEVLHDYIVASRIPKRHFCYRNFLDSLRGLKKEYLRFPEIRTRETDLIIKKLYGKGNYLRSALFSLRRKIIKKIKRLLIFF
jgi:glycosyltransferase involved in cell wall biosynthesis